jgi:signal transduction histidine kinase
MEEHTRHVGGDKKGRATGDHRPDLLPAPAAVTRDAPTPPNGGSDASRSRAECLDQAIDPAPTAAGTDTVDVLVNLLAEIDTATEVDEFYDRVCEGVCRLTTMERVGLFLYDRTLRSVRAVGSHGLDSTLLEGVEGTLEETPIAQRALSSDEVVEASEGLEREVPERYARFAGITTLTCIPVSAGGRWFGVIFADRGGGRFELTAGERQRMWTMGKLAALAASVEQATIQREAARRLSDRMALIREIHERVIQRLFGLLLAMGSDEALTDEGRALCHDELREVLRELRSALGGSLAPRDERSSATLRQIADRIEAQRANVTVRWAPGVEVPGEIEPLAQTVMLEALRNADKHADAEHVTIAVDSSDGNFAFEVMNDGVRDAAPGTGLGLRLATVEALEHNGIVEFGPVPPDRWHVRLLVPQGS